METDKKQEVEVERGTVKIPLKRLVMQILQNIVHVVNISVAIWRQEELYMKSVMLMDLMQD